MAKTCTLLTEGNHTAGGTTVNTASISPSAGAVVILAFVYDSTTLTASGNGLTYTEIHNSVTVDGGRFIVLVGAGASPTTGVIGLGFDDGAFVNWKIVQLAGTVQLAGVTNTNHVAANGSSTAPAVTLNAFANAANGTLVYVYAIDFVNITQGTGFTMIDMNPGTAMFGHSDAVMYQDANDTSVDATLDGSAGWGIIGIEIVDSAGGGGGSSIAAIRRYFSMMRAGNG